MFSCVSSTIQYSIDLEPAPKSIKPTLRRKYHARRIVESSDSEDGENNLKASGSKETIEPSDSSPERLIPRNTKHIEGTPVIQLKAWPHTDENPWNDDAILTL